MSRWDSSLSVRVTEAETKLEEHDRRLDQLDRYAEKMVSGIIATTVTALGTMIVVLIDILRGK